MNDAIVDQAAAAHRAIVATGHIVQKQAFVMAFSDMFHHCREAMVAAPIRS